MIKISIIVGNEITGLRAWPSVPRVGDFVKIGNGMPEAAKKHVRVLKIVWFTGVDSDDCRVELHCKEEK